MDTKKIILAVVSLVIIFSAFVALADDGSLPPKVEPTKTPKVERDIKGVRERKDRENVDAKVRSIATPVKTPKIERDNRGSGETRVEKDIARRECRLRKKEAERIFDAAMRTAKFDYKVAVRKARSDWRSSDKGAVAKQARRLTEKNARDILDAAKGTARDAWKTAVDAHNQCVRKNPSPSPSATVSATPASTPIPSSTSVPTETAVPTATSTPISNQ